MKKYYQLHHQSFIVDGHADTFWRIAMKAESKHIHFRSTAADFFQSIKKTTVGKMAKSHIDYQRFKDGGLNLQFMAIYTPPKFTGASAIAFALKMLVEILYAIKKGENKIRLIKSGNDLKQCVKDDAISFLISIEGGNPLNQDLALLEVFYKLGVRAMGLTHNPHNDLGDGIGVKKPRGLTAFGKAVVKEMNRLGMIIDIAHLAKPGFNDVIRLTDSPIISSHTGVKALVDIPRNLDDEQIKEIARLKGVIGIFYIPQYVRKFTHKKDRTTVKDVVDHIEYVADKVGVDYVGLGSDFDGYGGITHGLEDVSYLPNLTAELVRRGFNQIEIRKILGGNFIRVIKNILQ